MKIRSILLCIFTVVFMFGCYTEGTKKDDEETPIPVEIVDATQDTIVSVAIAGLENLVFSDKLGTVKNGFIEDVSTDGNLDLIGSIDAVNGENAVFISDNTTDTVNYFVTSNDIAIETDLEPGNALKIANSGKIYEIGGMYYLIDQDKNLKSLSIDSSGDIVQLVLKTEVEQFAVDQSGDIIYQDDSGIFYRKTNGFSVSLSNTFQGDVANWDFYPATKNFFFALKIGFIVLQSSVGGDFYKVYNDNGLIKVRYGQANAYQEYIDNNTLYTSLITDKSPEDCRVFLLDESYLLDCGINEIYEFYDTTADVVRHSLVWAEVFGETMITAVNEHLYVAYGDDFQGFRLTRVNLKNTTCQHIFSADYVTQCGGMGGLSTPIAYKINKTPISIADGTADSIIFCGVKLYNGANIIAEITNANTMPRVKQLATDFECKELLSF